MHLDNQLTASYLIPCPTEQLSQAVLYNCNKPTNCLKYKLGYPSYEKQGILKLIGTESFDLRNAKEES